MKRDDKVVIAADKTTNFYKTEKDKYNQYYG